MKFGEMTPTAEVQAFGQNGTVPLQILLFVPICPAVYFRTLHDIAIVILRKGLLYHVVML